MLSRHRTSTRRIAALFLAGTQLLFLTNCDEEDDGSDSGADASSVDASADAVSDESAPEASGDGSPSDTSPPNEAAPDVLEGDGGFADATPDTSLLDAAPDTSTPASFYVGGTASGVIGSGLVLQIGAANFASITTSGPFKSPFKLAVGTAYTATVYSQPTKPAQTCVLTNESGTVPNADVTNVGLVCTTNAYSIKATVSGLTGGGLVLHNNNGEDLAVSGNGTLAFTTKIVVGGSYYVTIKTQPSAYDCSITSSANGTVGDTEPAPAVIECKPGAPGKNTFNPPPGNANTDLYAPLSCVTSSKGALSYFSGGPCDAGPCTVVQNEPTDNWLATGHVRFDTTTRLFTFDIAPDRDLMTAQAYPNLSATYGKKIGAITQQAIKCGMDTLYGLPSQATDCTTGVGASLGGGYSEAADGIRFDIGGSDSSSRMTVAIRGSVLLSGGAYVIDVETVATKNTASSYNPQVTKTTTSHCSGVTQ